MQDTIEVSTAKKSTRGFASMSLERCCEVARAGAQEVHKRGTAHTFTSDEARAAGVIGRQRRREKKLLGDLRTA